MADTDVLSKPQIRASLIIAMIDGADKGVVAHIADLLGLRDDKEASLYESEE